MDHQQNYNGIPALDRTFRPDATFGRTGDSSSHPSEPQEHYASHVDPVFNEHGRIASTMDSQAAVHTIPAPAQDDTAIAEERHQSEDDPPRAASTDPGQDTVPPEDTEWQPEKLNPTTMREPTATIPARPPPRSGGARGGRAGGMSLALLIEEGILEPGEDVLTVEYKGEKYYGNLLPDGRITCPRHLPRSVQEPFESPSRFSVEVKQILNPSRKADDGWKSIKYQGRFLEYYKHEYIRQKFPGEASLPPLEPRAAKRARMSTDHGGVPSSFRFGRPTDAFMVERPRRVRRAPPRFAALGADDEYALQPLEKYAPGKQPFAVRVSPAAVAMMDFHAHLCMNEVIGILAGTWNPSTQELNIVRAYPVKELETEDDSINVEMCPEDQVARMYDAEQIGLKMVGWYHSHPWFATLPSTIDVYNQVLQQHAHRQEDAAGPSSSEPKSREADGNGRVSSLMQGVGASLDASPNVSGALNLHDKAVEETGTEERETEGPSEPYVAAIVGPYDPSLTSSNASITWFYVDHRPGVVPTEGQRPDDVGCVAKELMVQDLLEPLGQLENLSNFKNDMEQLAKRYAELPDRANLLGLWREDKTCLDKLVESVVSRLGKEHQVLDPKRIENFAFKLGLSTQAVWNVYGKPLSSIHRPAASGVTGATSQGGSEGVTAGVPSLLASAASEGRGEETEGSEETDDIDDEPISEDETI